MHVTIGYITLEGDKVTYNFVTNLIFYYVCNYWTITLEGDKYYFYD